MEGHQILWMVLQSEETACISNVFRFTHTTTCMDIIVNNNNNNNNNENENRYLLIHKCYSIIYFIHVSHTLI